MRSFLLALLVFLFGCSESNVEENPGNTNTNSSNHNNEGETALVNAQSPITDAEVLVSNLIVPWEIVKVNDQFYLSERGGQIINVTEDREKLVMSLNLNKEISAIGEGGLLGFILDPEFRDNSSAYIYHTYQEEGRILNRIVKIRKDENDNWIEESVLIDQIPGGRIHNGGRLAIGPDGKLYITVGDAGNQDSAQNLTVLSGKILRINLDGSIPEDNPFDNSPIYSYGHRNPQGVAWGESDTMYSTEHGSAAHDEINIIKPGRNYGWPVIQGDEQRQGMEKPLFHSGNDTWAPSGLAYYQEKLFVAALAGQQLRIFDLDSKTSEPLYENVGRLRDLLIEGNSLYIITNNTDGRGNPDEDDDHLLKLNLSVIEL